MPPLAIDSPATASPGAASPSVAPRRRSSRIPAATATAAELDALFALKAPTQDDAIASTGITQDDLDRLFAPRGVR